MEQLSLSSLELIVDEAIPDETYLKKAFAKVAENKALDESDHLIECDIIGDGFYWFYSSYGKAMPRPDKIIDKAAHTTIDNPRTEDQVEPTHQLFAIYDSVSTLLYISSSAKTTISILIEHLSSFTEKEVTTKKVWKSKDEFINMVDDLKSIQFTGSRDLFHQKNDIFDRVRRHIFALGEPEEFLIKAKYTERLKKSAIRKLLSLFPAHQETGSKATLVCIGRDKAGFEKVFNTGELIHKINISANRDEQGLFPPEDVKQEVITKLKKMRNVQTS